MDGLHRSFDSMKTNLLHAKSDYLTRKEAMKQQVARAAMENETLKKQLAGHDVAKDLEETEKRLRHYERTVFELNDFVESKTRETDFESVKAKCLVMLDSLNNLVVKKYSMSPGQNKYQLQQESKGMGGERGMGAKW